MSLTRRFRQAKPASASWNLAKTFLQSIVFWGVFLVLLPITLLWIHARLGIPRLAFDGKELVGILLFSLFSAINIWSGATMAVVGQGTPLPTDCPRRLVIAGPYRFVRNPMAIGGLGQGLAIGIGTGAWLLFAAVILGGLLWNYFVRPIEEAHLSQVFGARFDEYSRWVRCWIPRVAPYIPPE